MGIEKIDNPENFGKYGESYLPEIEQWPIEKHIELLTKTKNLHEFLSLPDMAEHKPFRLTIKPNYDVPEFVFDSSEYAEVIQRNQVYHYTSVINLPMIFKYGLLPEAWRNPEQVAGLEGVAIDKGSFVDRYADFDDPNRFIDRRELVTDPHLKRVGKHEKLINKALEYGADNTEKLKTPSQDPNMGLFKEGKEVGGEVKWNSPSTVSAFYAYLPDSEFTKTGVRAPDLANEFEQYPHEALFDLYLSDDVMRPNLIIEDCELALQRDPDESDPKLYRGGDHSNEIAISGRTKPSQIKGIFFVVEERHPDFNKKVSEWPYLQELYTPLANIKREYQNKFDALQESEKVLREGKRYEALINFLDQHIVQGQDTLLSFYKSFGVPIYATYRIDHIATGQYETGYMDRMGDLPAEPRSFLSDLDRRKREHLAKPGELGYASRIEKFGLDKIINNANSMNFRVFEEL